MDKKPHTIDSYILKSNINDLLKSNGINDFRSYADNLLMSYINNLKTLSKLDPETFMQLPIVQYYHERVKSKRNGN